MDYSFIDDPELRDALKRRRRKLSSSKPDSELNSKINSKNQNKKAFDSTKTKPKKNKKFESLKAKKQLEDNKKKKLKTPSTKSLAIATKQLSSMIRTGLPLLEALNILSESNENKTLKFVFRDASLGISRGSTFTSMLEKYPEIFNEMYLALVAAGETAGLLPDVLDREAGLLESLAKIKGQISSALAYPIAIFTLTVAVIIIMLVFVIPIFVDMYSSSGTDLPGLTQILVDASMR